MGAAGETRYPRSLHLCEVLAWSVDDAVWQLWENRGVVDQVGTFCAFEIVQAGVVGYRVLLSDENYDRTTWRVHVSRHVHEAVHIEELDAWSMDRLGAGRVVPCFHTPLNGSRLSECDAGPDALVIVVKP